MQLSEMSMSHTSKAQGGYSLTFNMGGGRANIWGPKMSLNQYLRSVNCNMDKNSIFGVHKSGERKDRGIFLALTSHGMQCDPEFANHETNVLLLF